MVEVVTEHVDTTPVADALLVVSVHVSKRMMPAVSICDLLVSPKSHIRG